MEEKADWFSRLIGIAALVVASFSVYLTYQADSATPELFASGELGSDEDFVEIQNLGNATATDVQIAVSWVEQKNYSRISVYPKQKFEVVWDDEAHTAIISVRAVGRGDRLLVTFHRSIPSCESRSTVTANVTCSEGPFDEANINGDVPKLNSGDWT